MTKSNGLAEASRAVCPNCEGPESTPVKRFRCQKRGCEVPVKKTRAKRPAPINKKSRKEINAAHYKKRRAQAAQKLLGVPLSTGSWDDNGFSRPKLDLRSRPASGDGSPRSRSGLQALQFKFPPGDAVSDGGFPSTIESKMPPKPRFDYSKCRERPAYVKKCVRCWLLFRGKLWGRKEDPDKTIPLEHSPGCL